MGNAKIAIGIIIGIIAIIGIVSIMNETEEPEESIPEITESSQPTELELITEGEHTYYIDENGTRHYIIDTVDTPKIDE